METLCKCGCGNPVGIAKWTDKRYGTVKGESLNYLPGHGPQSNPGKEGYKTCRKCEIEKPLDEFHIDKRSLDKRTTYCKECRWEIERNARLVRTYGITQKEYENLCQSQNNLCFICRKEKKLHIDHNHLTGRVRGLLCSTCNSALGGLHDNVDNLRRAINYLQADLKLV